MLSRSEGGGGDASVDEWKRVAAAAVRGLEGEMEQVEEGGS